MNLGRIITFYSYKGGVGRSFVMANIAAILAKWGCKVLCVDWDLEAPGLHHFFPDVADSDNKNGLIHLMESAAKAKPLSWKKCVHTATIGATGKQVDVIPAGREAKDYVQRVHALDWKALYDKHRLGEFLDRLRIEWKTDYDFVLLDSRTGLTDIGGICTVHLPDFIVQVFTANEQSMDGTQYVATQVKERRKNFFYSNGQALILPLLSRWEDKDAPDAAKQWLPRITKMVTPAMTEWKQRGVTISRLVELLKIPYKAEWNFGERIVQESDESSTSPGSVSHHLHLVAALLARDFTETQQLCESPDEYVRVAEATAKGRRISEPAKTLPVAAEERRARAIIRPHLEADSSDFQLLSLIARKYEMAVARSAPAGQLEAIRVELNQLRAEVGLPPLPAESPTTKPPVKKTPSTRKAVALKRKPKKSATHRK